MSGKEKTHKHKQICGIVLGLGGWQNFVYVFFRSFLNYEGEKTHKQNPPKIPGQSRENSVYVFSLYVFFSQCWPVFTRPFSFLPPSPLPPLFLAPFLPFLPSKMLCSVEQGAQTELGKGQFQDGSPHKFREGNPSRNLREKKGQNIAVYAPCFRGLSWRRASPASRLSFYGTPWQRRSKASGWMPRENTRSSRVRPKQTQSMTEKGT